MHLMERVRQGKVWKRCLAAVLLIGLAAHAAGMFGGISFHDDVVCTYDVGTTHIFGRFTLGLLGKLTRVPFGGNNYSLPWFNGLLSLFLIAGFSWLTVRLLRIANPVLQVLLCGIFVTFPVVTSTFAYNFTAPYYMAALFLCAVSAGLLTGRFAVRFHHVKPAAGSFISLLFGMLIMALMIGIYQAYLPALLTLEILVLMEDEMELTPFSGQRKTGQLKAGTGNGPDSAGREERAVQKDTSLHKNSWLKKWSCAFFGTAAGFLGYLVLMKLSLQLTGKQLYAYRGLDTMGTGGSSYPERILWAYKIFFNPDCFVEKRGSTDYLMFMWSMAGVYRILVVIGIVMVLACGMVMFRRRRDTVALIRYLILAAVLPLAMNFIFVMTDFDVYGLMVYGQVFVFTVPMMCADYLLKMRGRDGLLCGTKSVVSNCSKATQTVIYLKADQTVKHEGRTSEQQDREKAQTANLSRIAAVTVAVLSAYSILFYCRYDNLCYYKASRMQQNAIAYDEVLISRIQQTKGYDPGMPVVFLNQFDKRVDEWQVDPELQSVTVTPYGVSEIINDYAWVNFMRIHCGYAPAVVEDDGTWESAAEKLNMPHYPEQGSILVDDGSLIVNF